MGDGPFRARIESAADRDRRNRHLTKDRAFGAHLVAFSVATGYWDLSDTDPLRPAFALFATSRQEEGPFLANIKLGRKLRIEGLGSSSKEGGHPMEFLKSAGYDYKVQRYTLRATVLGEDGEATTVETPGSLIEAFVPELYEHVPSMRDPQRVRFLMSPKLEVLRRESAGFKVNLAPVLARFKKKHAYDTPPVFDHATVAAEGRRFVASLNERTMVPILHHPDDPTFHVQLLLSALANGYAKRDDSSYYTPSDRGFRELGMHRAKRAPGLAFSAAQDDVAGWLADETKLFDDAR